MAASVLGEYRKRVDELDAEIARDGSDGHGARAAAKARARSATAKLRVIVQIQESRAGAGIDGAVDRHFLERHGHRRPRAAPSRACAAGCRATPCCLPATRRPARAAALLKDGAKFTRIHGEDVPVRARIEAIDSMSAHADANEIMRWLGGFTQAAGADVPRPRRTGADGRAQGAHRDGARLDREDAGASGENGTLMDTHSTCSNRSTTPRSCSTTRTASSRCRSIRRSLPGTCTRPRSPAATSTTTSATRTSLEMREVLEEILDARRPASIPTTLAGDPPLHEAVLDQLRPAQQHDLAKVRAEVHAGGAAAAPLRSRERNGAQLPLTAGRVGGALLARLSGAVLRSRRRRDGDEQDARRRPRHPVGQRQQPLRRRHDGRPRGLRGAATA